MKLQVFEKRGPGSREARESRESQCFLATLLHGHPRNSSRHSESVGKLFRLRWRPRCQPAAVILSLHKFDQTCAPAAKDLRYRPGYPLQVLPRFAHANCTGYRGVGFPLLSLAEPYNEADDCRTRASCTTLTSSVSNTTCISKTVRSRHGWAFGQPLYKQEPPNGAGFSQLSTRLPPQDLCYSLTKKKHDITTRLSIPLGISCL